MNTMAEHRHFLPEIFLLRWISFVQQFKVWIILILLISAGLSLLYIKNNLGMNTDTKDMLSPQLQWRQLDLEYERNFPQSTNNILVVIESATPDQAIDSAAKLYEHLKDNSKLFETVYYPGNLPFFKQSAFLYLNTDELQDLADNLAAIQPFLARLVNDQNMRGLFSMLTEALQAIRDGEEIDLSPLLKQINHALSAILSNQPFQVSWHNLMQGQEKSGDVHREFIIIQPHLDYSNLLPATDAIESIRNLANKLDINQQHGVRLRLTGGVVLSHEELLSVSRGNIIAVVLALMIVTVILVFGLGSAWLVIASLITLLTGLVFTAAMATLTVGELNLISVAFAVLYIGLGIDFAIHFCLHYRELRQKNISNTSSLRDTSVQIGRSLLLCSITTAIGFFAFMPTDYDGVAELGWISGVGMFISLFITMSLLPALLSAFPLQQNEVNTNIPLSDTRRRLLSFPLNHAGSIRLVSIILVLGLIVLIPNLFDHNTLNLQDPGNESVITYKDLLADSDTSPWSGKYLAKGEEEAQKLIKLLSELDTVDKVIWLEDFVPGEQDEKLAIVDEMDLLLGTLPEKTTITAINYDQQIASIKSFQRELLNIHSNTSDDHVGALKIQLARFLQHLENQSGEAQTIILNDLETRLIASLPGRISALSAALDAKQVDKNDLPPEFVSRWLNQDHYLLDILPRENIIDNGALRRFVKELQAAEPQVIGSPVVSIEASDAVVSAFQHAFTYALIAIVLILFVLMHTRKDAIIIISCLLMGALLTAGIAILLGVPLNFANIIALPLLLGIGVDSGIHITHRYRTILINNRAILATSSARGVVVSALTTICSIGNLTFSSHRGTASMGELLAIGIAMMLICMLILLPALLASDADTQPDNHQEI
jgi:hopanoid biosynthesis associated RND transporter like protein HpnN